MKPIEWLEGHVHGFLELPEADRQAILHFALLWSLFESTALDTRASSAAIVTLVKEWWATGMLRIEPYEKSLRYFQNRYFQDGEPTPQFAGLNLRRNDNPELVRSVFSRENANVTDSVSALLIVVYRLRNNLFHGEKWAYGIRGQLRNFTEANNVLMATLPLTGQF